MLSLKNSQPLASTTLFRCDSLSSQKRAAENNVSDIQGKEGHYLNLIPLNNILDASTATDCLSTRRKEEYSLPAWDHLEKAHRTTSRKRMASVGERLLDQLEKDYWINWRKLIGSIRESSQEQLEIAHWIN